jgi:hypothetical protein
MAKRKILSRMLCLVLVYSIVLVACHDENDKLSTDDLNQNPTQTYTVSFEANGGSPVPTQQIVKSGGKVAQPSNITKEGYGFGNWYKEAELINQWNFEVDTVISNVTLHAKWNLPLIVSGANFNDKMRWLEANAQSGGYYIVEVDTNQSINPIILSYSDKNNIVISLKGTGLMPTIINLNSFEATMFTVGAGVTLILADKLELKGTSYSGSYLIETNSNGNLIINHGVKVTGNSGSDSGGCIYVNGSGVLTMNGGEILGNNSIPYGSCGVYINANGQFTMNNGKISDNKYGGVFIMDNGTFIMADGEISNNVNNSGSTNSGGGGVYVNGSFKMSGGKIFGNIAKGSNFNNGGGVYVDNNGTFTMSGGEIYANTTASSYSGCGGGVYINGSVFYKTGGTIFGYIIGDINSNTVNNNYDLIEQNRGHAVYINHNNNIYKMGKDTISGFEDNLSFNGKISSPVWSGVWDF